MRRGLLLLALLVAAVTVTAEDLTVGMILSAQRAGADANGLVKMINDPVYATLKVTPADLETLKAAGVPAEAIAALQARMPVPTPAPPATSPDDKRLVDIARLVKSGLSESLIIDQIKGASQSFDLSVNDLVYLKENGVSEPIIKELLATKGKPAAAAAAPVVAPVAAPAAGAAVPAPGGDVTINDLVLVKPTFLKKNRPGHLVVKQDELSWVDGSDATESFSFKVGGIEKLWFSCVPKGMTNFCFQLNIQIAKGARYRFQDVNKETGSNDAVQRLEQVIKARFPNVLIGEPEIDD